MTDRIRSLDIDRTPELDAQIRVVPDTNEVVLPGNYANQIIESFTKQELQDLAGIKGAGYLGEVLDVIAVPATGDEQ